MREENVLDMVVCPCCGGVVPVGKFCPECGHDLIGARTATQAEINAARAKAAAPGPSQRPVSVSSQASSASSQPKALSDEGLTLLVNTCKKKIATVGGDGYSEIALYLDEKTEKYWLHTYAKYAPMNEEVHASYQATPALAQKVMGYIKDHDLATWKDHRGFTMTGGNYILRFQHGNEWIRLDSTNMQDGQKAWFEIDSMLHSEATEANRRYAER